AVARIDSHLRLLQEDPRRSKLLATGRSLRKFPLRGSFHPWHLPGLPGGSRKTRAGEVRGSERAARFTLRPQAIIAAPRSKGRSGAWFNQLHPRRPRGIIVRRARASQIHDLPARFLSAVADGTLPNPAEVKL